MSQEILMFATKQTEQELIIDEDGNEVNGIFLDSFLVDSVLGEVMRDELNYYCNDAAFRLDHDKYYEVKVGLENELDDVNKFLHKLDMMYAKLDGSVSDELYNTIEQIADAEDRKEDIKRAIEAWGLIGRLMENAYVWIEFSY